MDRIKMLVEKKYKIIVILFFAVYLSVGISIFRDYGISWDERYSRTNGIMAIKYVLEGNQGLFAYKDRYYGTAFEILLVAIEKILKLTKDLRIVYFMRHLATFLLFYTSVIFFYLLCRDRFKSWKVGLLGSLFLILSPRIFAHSFYNSKDIPFMAMFIISVYTLIRYLDKKTVFRAVLHALSSAFLIDIRIAGIILPFFTLIFLIADLSINKTKGIKATEIVIGFIMYIIFLVYCVILFWPTLWTNPLYHFIEAFRVMSRFHPFVWSVLYFGDYINAKDLPWHYIPVWIAISTPIFYIASFFIGCFVTAKSLLRNLRKFYVGKRDDLIFILWFSLPLVVVIGKRSVLYDEWRQMFFIYPAFLMLSLIGLASLYESIKLKSKGLSYKITSTAFILVIAFSLINIARFMIRYHPYQNVYFNRFAGKDMNEVKNNFELDYWGLSYREALEYILRNDKAKTIKIYVDNVPGQHTADILSSDDKNRLIYVENLEEAKYFLGDYRWHKEEYSRKQEYYSIKVGGAKIMVVYKLKPDFENG